MMTTRLRYITWVLNQAQVIVTSPGRKEHDDDDTSTDTAHHTGQEWTYLQHGRGPCRWHTASWG
jgi:hypothetical protein